MTQKHMSVEEVIAALQKVKDKDTLVYGGVGNLTIPVISVTEESEDVYRKVLLNVEYDDGFTDDELECLA